MNELIVINFSFWKFCSNYRGRGRGRGASRGLGNRGRGRNNYPNRRVPTKEELDRELDQYMSTTKASLDKELDSMMSTDKWD